jgi:ribonucleotide monophosphatase NagD (HAD superfamily)
MKDYNGYIFDMDGVIYRGDEIIHDAVNTINILKQRLIRNIGQSS